MLLPLSEVFDTLGRCPAGTKVVLLECRLERSKDAGEVKAFEWDKFLVSLAGPVTYPNARALPEVARFVPADRLVVETDCPFLPPQGYRGRRNEPAYLALTAARIAELRGETLDTLGPRMSDNARRLYRVD